MSRHSIFITGAGQGIGRATAEHFAARGWLVGACDIQSEGLASLQAQLGEASCWTQTLDVRDARAWRAVLKSFWKRAEQRLDVLLNNAGIASAGAFQDIALDAHHAVVDVNLKGVINGCHTGFDYLRQTPGARLINLASASAIYGAAELASYSSTKFAVRGLTEALDLEWRALGIRVCDIWPLFVRTPMVEGIEIASLKSLGLRLSAEDVAHTIWKAATQRGHRIHWRVGFQARAMYQATCFLPDALNRAVTAKLSGH